MTQETTNSRRSFFRWLTGRGVATFEEAMGRPQLALSDLPNLPPEELGRLIPTVCPSTEILIREDHVIARTPPDGADLVLFPVSSLELTIFNLFNGQNTLLQAVQRVGAECGVEQQDAMSVARDLFLRLVAHAVCAPANSTVYDAPQKDT